MSVWLTIAGIGEDGYEGLGQKARLRRIPLRRPPHPDRAAGVSDGESLHNEN